MAGGGQARLRTTADPRTVRLENQNMNWLKSLLVGKAPQPDSAWPFEDAKNVAVFTTAGVIERKELIIHASHDEDDGAWQFHSAGSASMDDARVVSLEEITRIEPAILQLADLPRGWTADRVQPGAPWQRKKT